MIKRMYHVHFKMSILILLQLFLNRSHFRIVNKKVFIQNNPHVLPIRIIERHQFRNILSVRLSNRGQLLGNNNGGNTHVACAKAKVDQLSRPILHRLSAGTVQNDERFPSLGEVHYKFKVVLHVILPAWDNKETVVLMNEILIIGLIPVIGRTNQEYIFKLMEERRP